MCSSARQKGKGGEGGAGRDVADVLKRDCGICRLGFWTAMQPVQTFSHQSNR